MKTILRIATIGLIIITMNISSIVLSQDIDRTQRPVGKATPTVKLPEIKKTTLKNGLNVWLVERHALPVVAFNLVIQAGSDHDPATQPGLASMVADLLDEGTQKRDALQISAELESIGTSLNVNSSWDGSFVTFNCLTKHLPKALDVFADVVIHPTFPEKEFGRVQKTRLTALMQQKDQATTIANNAFSFILYGNNHPYGNNPSGSEQSIGAMAPTDLRKFYETYYRPNNATLIIVGDATLKSIAPMLESAMADWKRADIPAFTVPTAAPIEKMKVYLVDKPGAAQSEIRIGYPAVPRSTPDYFPLTVMNRMLGGQFTSRINLNLREKHGYTYGARSGFAFQKGAGPFSASAGVQTIKSDSSVREFLNEINLMHDKGMTEQELDFVKKGLVGNFALSFETSMQIAGALQNIILYGLPENYFNNYLQNIDRVSLQDVGQVSKKYLDTSKMVVLVVGDLSQIKESIAKLNLGDIVVCGVDGKPIQ
jgi:zinc protease